MARQELQGRESAGEKGGVRGDAMRHTASRTGNTHMKVNGTGAAHR